MRAWIELPDPGWAAVRLATAAMHRLGYRTEVVRGSGAVLLRLSGSRLDAGELWRLPGEG